MKSYKNISTNLRGQLIEFQKRIYKLDKEREFHNLLLDRLLKIKDEFDEILKMTDTEK